MTHNFLDIQTRYANAVYQAEKFRLQAEALKRMLDAVAAQQATASLIDLEESIAVDPNWTSPAVVPPPTTDRPHLYSGFNSKVAERLGVSRSHVSRVANGTRRSPRIEAAIREYAQEIENQRTKPTEERVG